MDALSEALNAVRFTGAIFYRLECSAPWGFSVPSLHDVGHILAPGAERLLSYHLVTDGEAEVRFAGLEPVAVAAGDVLVIPRGEAHTVTNGSPVELIDSGASLRDYLSGSLSTMRVDGGGEMTRFICGYFGCERGADRLFLAGLPTMIKINIRGDAAGAWLENSIRHLVSDGAANRPGRSVLLSKASEALFIETLRRYTEQLPPEQIGWLAGARDPVVGGALALLHRRPFHGWTLDALVRELGTSRSVLMERFSRYLGEPPLAYLARWRLQLASRLLETSRRKTIMQVASEVGYESEAAFNRAFKREFGTPPARYRKQRENRDTVDVVRKRGRPSDR
jgi:AraC-like DNA-binding protein